MVQEMFPKLLSCEQERDSVDGDESVKSMFQRDSVDGDESVKSMFHRLINIIEQYYNKSITSKKKYSAKIFDKENYHCPMYYDCLRISEIYSGSTKIHDMTALSHFRSMFLDFKHAFDMLTKYDKVSCIHDDVIHLENIKLKLANLMKRIPGSDVKVPQKFDQEEIENKTKEYIAHLPPNQMPIICPKLSKDSCKIGIMGYVILNQFSLNLQSFRGCLEQLKKVSP